MEISVDEFVEKNEPFLRELDDFLDSIEESLDKTILGYLESKGIDVEDPNAGDFLTNAWSKFFDRSLLD